MIYRYMKAHIRNNGVDPTGWSPMDIQDSFLLLPEPRIGFDVWSAVIGQSEEPEQKELTPEDILKENDKAIDKLGAING